MGCFRHLRKRLHQTLYDVHQDLLKSCLMRLKDSLQFDRENSNHFPASQMKSRLHKPVYCMRDCPIVGLELMLDIDALVVSSVFDQCSALRATPYILKVSI